MNRQDLDELMDALAVVTLKDVVGWTISKYEEFLANPNDSLKSLSQFCGLMATDEAIRQIVKATDASRAYAFRRDPELCVFAGSKVKELQEYGY